MKYINAMILFVLFGVTLSYSQPSGVFQSAEDLEVIPKPENYLQHTFLYRIGDQPSEFNFLKITMSDLLYSNKKVYLWPSDVDQKSIYRMPIYASREHVLSKKLVSEIIINNRLIVSTADSLFYKKGDSVKVLKRIPPPGIAMIQSEIPATLIQLNVKSQREYHNLPSFVYTRNDTAQVIVVQSPSRMPVLVNPYTKAGAFRTINVIPSTYPEIRLKAKSPLELPTVSVPDSNSLRQVDSLIRQLSKYYIEDSLAIWFFTDSTKKMLGSEIPRQNFESEGVYASRQAFFGQIADSTYRSIADWNHVHELLMPLSQKKGILESYREQHVAYLQNEEFKRAQDFRTGLIRHLLWNHIYMSTDFTVGRNMKLQYASPGPSRLMGGALRLMGIHPLWKRLSWQWDVLGSWSRWKYQESTDLYSQQMNAVINLKAAIPIGVAPAGNFSLDTTRGVIIQGTLGPSLTYRETNLLAQRQDTTMSNVAYGAVIGMDIYVGSFPILIGAEYSYYHDGFGDLFFRIGIPIFGRRP